MATKKKSPGFWAKLGRAFKWLGAVYFSRHIALTTIAVLLLIFGAIGVFGLGKVSDEQFVWGFSFTALKFIGTNVGTGILVAILIVALIDRPDSSLFLRSLNAKIKKLTQQTFVGAFDRAFPAKLLEETKQSLFESTAYREKMEIHYTIELLKIDDNGRAFTGERQYLLIKARMDTDLQNVTSVNIRRDTCLSLPDPVYPELRKLVGVIRVKIANRAMTQTQLAAANTKLQNQLKRSNTTRGTFTSTKFDLPPKKKVKISYEYTMVKELEDTELIQTVSPTEEMTIVVHPPKGVKLLFFARPTLPGRPAERGYRSDGTFALKTLKYTLPNHGIILWWKLK